MSCQKYREAMDEAIDSMSVLDSEARAHAEDCASCNEYYEGQKILTSRLRSEAAAFSPTPTDNLEHRTLATLSAIKNHSQTVHKTSFARWVVAASILFVLFGGQFLYSQWSEQSIRADEGKRALEVLSALEDELRINLMNTSIAESVTSNGLTTPINNELENLKTDTLRAGYFLLHQLPFNNANATL